MKENLETKTVRINSDGFWKKLNQWLSELLTPKNIAVFLSVLYLLSILPLLFIAKYNYPSADDYTNGVRCHQIWITEHSITSVLKEAFSRTAEEWLTWRGCFTSSFLSALTPNIWGENWYAITPFLVFIMLSFSTVYFFRAVLVKALRGDKYISHGIAMIVLLLSVQCMPETARAESFYWYSGAINYIFLHGLSLLFYGLLISTVTDKGKKRIWDVSTASVLGFLVSGGNQMTMLNAAVILMLVILILTYRKKWKNNKILIVPLGLFWMGFLLSVVAPGNFARAGASVGMNPIKAILVSFYYCLDFALGKWTTWPVLIAMISVALLFWRIAHNTAFSFPCPLLAAFFGYCLVSAMFTPPLFVMGNVAAGRLQGLAFLMYILVLVLCVGYVTGWMRKKYDGRVDIAGGVFGRQKMTDKDKFGAESCICLLFCLGFLMFGSALTVIPEPHYYTVTSALTDLLSGSAAAYGKEQEERIEVYKSGAEKGRKGIVEVKPLTAQPEILFFSDIVEDAGDWTNRGIARFYGLDGVRVTSDGEFKE